MRTTGVTAVGATGACATGPVQHDASTSNQIRMLDAYHANLAIDKKQTTAPQ